jgi:hypothetical protein
MTATISVTCDALVMLNAVPGRPEGFSPWTLSEPFCARCSATYRYEHYEIKCWWKTCTVKIKVISHTSERMSAFIRYVDGIQHALDSSKI